MVGATWVQQLRSQPWFPQVEAEAQQAGIPDYLWMAIVAQEDPSFGETPTYDPASDGSWGYSYGLFQLRQGASGGMGTGYTPAQLEDPVTNAQIAFSRLKNVVSSSSDPLAQLDASMTAGWPGADPTLDAAERPGRVANLQSVLNQLGQPLPGSPSNAGAPSSTGGVANAGGASPIAGLLGVPSFDAGTSGVSHSLAWNVVVIGAIALLAIGGFMIISRGAVPVPV